MQELARTLHRITSVPDLRECGSHTAGQVPLGMCAPQLGDRVREALMDRSGSAEEQAVRYVTAVLEAADGKQKSVRSLMMSMMRHGWMGLSEDFFNAYFHLAPSARKYVKLVSLRDTENGPRTLAVQTLDLPQGPLPFSLMHDLCKTYPAIRLTSQPTRWPMFF